MKKLIPVLLFIFVICIYGFTDYNQILNTSLKITVVDYLGNEGKEASVTLYPTDKDYRNETNPVTDNQYTDKKGKVTFKKIEPTVYFVYVVKDDMNNIGGGVQTDTLVKGKINKVNIVIE